VSGKILVDAETWVQTFEVALDKVHAATMSLGEAEPRDEQGNIVDPYQRGYLDGVTEIARGVSGTLAEMTKVIERMKRRQS